MAGGERYQRIRRESLKFWVNSFDTQSKLVGGIQNLAKIFEEPVASASNAAYSAP